MKDYKLHIQNNLLSKRGTVNTTNLKNVIEEIVTDVQSSLVTDIDNINTIIDGFGYGTSSQSTDGDGLLSITHNLLGTPGSVIVTPIGSTPYILNVTVITAEAFQVLVSNAAGAPVASTAVGIAWFAR